MSVQDRVPPPAKPVCDCGCHHDERDAPVRLDARRVEKTYTIINGYDVETDYVTEWETCRAPLGEVITSRTSMDDIHMPVLDIDFPVTVRESSPGRSHVFIDKTMTWRQYKRLLRALRRAGIVEKDWVRLAMGRRWSCVWREGWGPEGKKR